VLLAGPYRGLPAAQLDPRAWLIVLGSAAAGTAGTELLPAILDRRSARATGSAAA